MSGLGSNQIEVGELLRINEQTFRWWCRRREEYDEAVLNRRLGRTSPKRVPADDEA